jgi:hypothetical protein
MPAELPIACSLSATALAARLSEMAALGDAALIEARTEPRRAELRFAAADGVRERVDAIVAAESQCCAFLTMRIGDEPGRVALTIEAPAGAEPVLDEIVAAFGGRTPA